MNDEYEVNCECDDCFDIARCSLATIQGVSLWLSSILEYDSAHQNEKKSDGHDVCPETRCFLLAAILFFFTKQLLSQDSSTSRPTTLEFCMGLFDTKGHFQTSCNIFPTVFLMAVIKLHF